MCQYMQSTLADGRGLPVSVILVFIYIYMYMYILTRMHILAYYCLP